MKNKRQKYKTARGIDCESEKKLGMGVASAALGLSLIGGGTFAFFSDKEVSNNTFAAGTLDLTLNPKTLVDIKDLKPGILLRRSSY